VGARNLNGEEEQQQKKKNIGKNIHGTKKEEGHYEEQTL
jgi:hypothetical protein